MKRLLLLIGFVGFTLAYAWGQSTACINTSLNPAKSVQSINSGEFDKLRPQGEKNQLTTSNHFLPKFALDNPSGYSFLCNLELKAENKLPVGIWVQLGDEKTPAIRPIKAVNLSYVQLKLLRF